MRLVRHAAAVAGCCEMRNGPPPVATCTVSTQQRLRVSQHGRYKYCFVGLQCEGGKPSSIVGAVFLLAVTASAAICCAVR
jgi:hypothetical protein